MSVDIKGSTKLQTSSDRKTFATTISTLLTEISELVALFHGHVPAPTPRADASRVTPGLVISEEDSSR